MIFATSVESFYTKHKEEIERLRLKSVTKPITHANLELVDFIDANGHQYYRFPKSMSLPIDRLGQLKMYNQYLAKGLTPEEDDAIDTAIEQALSDGLSNPKSGASARIGALVMERKKRKEFTFHTELFYNILAVQWVRDDESPTKFDSAIQLEKVKTFIQEENKDGICFFFHQPELKGLTSILQILEKDVPTYLAESKAKVQELTEKLTLINSFKSISKNAKENGTKN